MNELDIYRTNYEKYIKICIKYRFRFMFHMELLCLFNRQKNYKISIFSIKMMTRKKKSIYPKSSIKYWHKYWLYRHCNLIHWLTSLDLTKKTYGDTAVTQLIFYSTWNQNPSFFFRSIRFSHYTSIHTENYLLPRTLPLHGTVSVIFRVFFLN